MDWGGEGKGRSNEKVNWIILSFALFYSLIMLLQDESLAARVISSRGTPWDVFLILEIRME